MEFGAGQEDRLQEVAVAVGLREVMIRKDLQGVPRFLFAVGP
jgi:hypothetical protein